MSDADRDNILAGLYRNAERLAPLLERLVAALDRLPPRDAPLCAVPPCVKGDALAPTLPGLPDDDWTPPDLTPPPREWGNTVRVYEWAWNHTHGGRFDLAEMFEHRDEIAEATKGKIGVATYQRVLSALVKAGAADRTREGYAVREPTDALREAVEAARKGGEKQKEETK